MHNIALRLQAMVPLQRMALLKDITLLKGIALLKGTAAEPTVDLPVEPTAVLPSTPQALVRRPMPFLLKHMPLKVQGPWEWHAGPGPSKRAGGSMCVTHTDIGRGYGYQAPCPQPKSQRAALNPQPLPPSGGGEARRSR
jgi:hypothetical protein